MDEIERVAATAKGSVLDLPAEFDGEVTDVSTVVDEQYNRKVINATVRIGDQDYTISYKPLHAKALAAALKGLDVESFDGHKYHFVRQDFGIGFPRPIPTAVLE